MKEAILILIMFCFGYAYADDGSNIIRVDMREGFGGRLATGIEYVGEEDGSAYSVFDTTLYKDGWGRMCSGSSTVDVCRLNMPCVVGGRLSESETWTTNRIYVVRDNVVVPTAVALTIPNGGIVKFTPNAYIYCEDGGILNMQGVSLVGIADDSIGGDTNMDGEISTPDVEEWIRGEASNSLVAVKFDVGDDCFERMYTIGCELGYVSVMSRTGYLFDGWWTEKDGGEQLTTTTVVTQSVICYAHWKKVGSGSGDEPEIDPENGDYIRNVTARQRFPWNGLVDIKCDVVGVEGSTNEYKFVVAAVMPDSGEVREVSHIWTLKNGAKSTDLTVATDGNYQLLWDAEADLGQVRYSNMVVRVTLDVKHNVIRDKVQLWEGGPYWATTNIGAENPEDYGYYFWWGDTVGYKFENDKWVASDGSSSNFSFSSSNTPTYNKDVSTLQSEGWIMADGVLAPEHDAAHEHWGGDWRMPTKQEFDDLNNKCDWTWATLNGVNGYVICGRGEYASNSIFLPCAGLGNGTSLNTAGSRGFYWSSVPSSDYAWDLYFNSGDHGTYYSDRFYGRSVRPLQGFTK